MPWSPDFVGSVELAGRQGRSVGLAEPVQRYFNAFETGRAHELEDMCPGHVAITPLGGGGAWSSTASTVCPQQLMRPERRVRIETVAKEFT